jgi:ABC-type protease/lipase transport system fused ATPase/permease subunit
MILGLPEGYDTLLDSTAAPLSGGQRQRIGLARAVFGSPALVVLDEPNSSLDGEGEMALRNLILTLKQEGITVLLITHRPTTLTALDKILVLTAGPVTHYGPVQQLLPKLVSAPPLLTQVPR